MKNIFTRLFGGLFGVPTQHPVVTKNESELKPNLRRAIVRDANKSREGVRIAEERAKRLLAEMEEKDAQRAPHAEQA